MEYSYWIIPIYKNINWEYKFLLINQKSQKNSFRWFPKWHKELWENSIQAAQRELEEETGIKNIQINSDKKWELQYKYNLSWIERNKKVFFRSGFVETQEVLIQSSEVNEHSRCTRQEAIDKLTHKDAKSMFIKICKYLEIE